MSFNTSSGREFSKNPVHSKTDSNGLQHNVYVMYHATKRHNVPSILRDGFKPSTAGMLGPGLYLSRDIDKTRAYGDVCLKVLAYTGKTRKMDSADNSGSWRAAYDSAYLPPNNKVVASGREETCLKSVSQVRILGVAYGFTNLNGKTRAEVRNLEGTTDSLDEEEERELRKMLQNIEDSSVWGFIEATNALVLDVEGSRCGGGLILYQKHGGNNQLWKLEKGVIQAKCGYVIDAGSGSAMTKVTSEKPNGSSNQQFDFDGNVFKCKAHGTVLDVEGSKYRQMANLIMYPEHGGNNQVFKFVPTYTTALFRQPLTKGS